MCCKGLRGSCSKRSDKSQVLPQGAGVLIISEALDSAESITGFSVLLMLTIRSAAVIYAAINPDAGHTLKKKIEGGG